MNILVPTDFSPCANSAFTIACEIARLHNGRLHLYHCADLPDDWEDLSIEEQVKDNINKFYAIDAKKKLLALKLKAEEVKVDAVTYYTGGKYLKNIEEVLDQVQIDLLIMGSKGNRAKEENYLGSKTQKVLRKFRKNALVIKDNKPFNPKKVVFVTGLRYKEREGFRSYLDFISKYDVQELHVLTIDTLAWFSQPTHIAIEVLEEFKEIAYEYNCITHFYQDYSIQSGIRHFTEENNIDLIGISYFSRNPIKRILLGSNVEMLVNSTSLPLLCLNEKVVLPAKEVIGSTSEQKYSPFAIPL